jgi:predicted Zn-dependent protease with MMP-like domain
VIVSDEQFQQFVQEAIGSLPDEFRSQIGNVAITIGDDLSDRSAYGRTT